MTLWGRTGYLAVTAALTLAVGTAWGARAAGARPSIAAGLATAWVVQAGAFWSLAGRLTRGRPALKAWGAGVAARVAGVGVLAVAAGPAGWSTAILLAAYGGAVVAQLMLEVLWLWKGAAGHPSRR